MRVLLANADRDFLHVFKKLLELCGHEADTVFDGAQALEKISNGGFDTVVLDQDIPRIRTKEIIKQLNDQQIPVIVITSKNINTELLTDPVLANDYLCLPFFPTELLEAVEKIAEKREGGAEKIHAPENIEINVLENKICGNIRLTNQEIRIFRNLCDGETVNPKNIGPYINSLNHKLEQLNKRTRIRYIMKEGYRLVMNHE